MAINDFFVWGSGGQKLTPEQVRQQRLQARLLQKQGADFSPAGHWSVALGRGLSGFMGGLQERRARDAEQAGIASANEAFSNSGIADLLAGGTGVGATPQASGGSYSAASYQPSGDELRDGIIATANSLGIDPVDLATAISYETAGTFDPTKAGPTTKWGRHRGLIQFGEPQAQQYGVDWNNPIASQLGENGAVAKYLRDTGVKPGMGLLDIYSAINAGGVGRYNRSDAAAGGAPGTVRDKVEQQMAAHRRKAMALLGGGGGQQPVQVASADPNFMPDVSSREIPLTALQPSPVAEVLATQPQMPQDTTAPVSQPNPVGEALLAQNDMALGGALASSAAPQQQRTAPNMAAILQLANNPYLNDTQRTILGSVLQQQMQANDPLRALQLQAAQQGLRRGELEIAAMQQPAAPEYGFQTLGDGTVVRTNKATGEVVPAYEGTPKPTTDVQNYEYARANGYQGSFADYQQDIKRAGASSTNVNVGGEGDAYQKKFWESMGAAEAKSFTDAMEAGDVARRNKVNLDRLSQLAASSPQGLEGAVINTLSNMGIKLDGASKVEAMESLISQLVPSQRPPGSGTISDADLALYKASLPRIINSPEGNQLILETLYAINQHDIAASEIAAMVAAGELSPTEARKEMRKIPNPFDDWQDKIKKIEGSDSSSSGVNKTKSGVTWSVN